MNALQDGGIDGYDESFPASRRGSTAFIAKGSANVPFPIPPHPCQRHRACIAAPVRHGACHLPRPAAGAAATTSGYVTDAILASGLSRGWSTVLDWFLEQGRWSWLRVRAALSDMPTMLSAAAVWYAVIDDSVVEVCRPRRRARSTHHNHNAKPNRPKFLRGQGWLCLVAVIERNYFAIGAVPLLLRLVRRGANRGKLRSAGLLLHLLGQRLGHVRLLLDALFMRAWLIHRALSAGHTAIGCAAPRSSPCSRCRSRPANAARVGRSSMARGSCRSGLRYCRSTAAPISSTASLSRALSHLSDCRAVPARRVVRAAWVELERPDRRNRASSGC